MLYKIEFLTIDRMKVKYDYELINASGWRSALQCFMDHEKYYFPIWILDINSQFKHGSIVGWQKGADFNDFVGIVQLNIDLGFSSCYNINGL